MNTINPVEVITESSIVNNNIVATINQEALEATKQGIINFVENVEITENNILNVAEDVKKITSFEKMILAGSTRFMDSFKEISYVDGYLKDLLSVVKSYKKKLNDSIKPKKNEIIEQGLKKELENRIELNLSFVKLKNKGIKSLEIPKKMFFEKYYSIKEPRGVTADGSLNINKLLEAQLKIIEDEEARLKEIEEAKLEIVDKKEVITIIDEQIQKLSTMEEVEVIEEDLSFADFPTMNTNLPSQRSWTEDFNQKQQEQKIIAPNKIDFDNLEKTNLYYLDDDKHWVEAQIFINKCQDTSKIGVSLVKGLSQLARKELKIESLRIELIIPLEISKVKGMGFELLRKNFDKLLKAYYNNIVNIEISFKGGLLDTDTIQF